MLKSLCDVFINKNLRNICKTKTTNHSFKQSNNICIVDLFVAPVQHPGQGSRQLRPPVARDAAGADQLHLTPTTGGDFRT